MWMHCAGISVWVSVFVILKPNNYQWSLLYARNFEFWPAILENRCRLLCIIKQHQFHMKFDQTRGQSFCLQRQSINLELWSRSYKKSCFSHTYMLKYFLDTQLEHQKRFLCVVFIDIKYVFRLRINYRFS